MKEPLKSFTSGKHVCITICVIFLILASVQINASYEEFSEATNNDDTTKKWTALYYIDADTSNPWWNILLNIDILNNKFINEIASDDNLNVLVLQDRRRDPAHIFYINENHEPVLLKENGEVNMGDPQTLADFINYGKQHYTADRYQLCIWSHANGWYGVCPDDSSGGDPLTMDEFQHALSSSGGVDLLCFIGSCQMGGIEAVYELRDYCDVYVSSESSGNGNDWYGMIDDMCELLNNRSDLSTVACGEQIVQLICDNPNEFYEDLTISAVQTDNIEALVSSFDDLCLHLFESNDDTYKTWLNAKNQSKKFRFIQGSWLLDIMDLMNQYQSLEDDPFISQMITNISMYLSQIIIAECHGENQNGSRGLSLFYSSKDQISTYMDANLDFCQDTHWDELLKDNKNGYSYKSNTEVIDYIDWTSDPLRSWLSIIVSFLY